MKWSIAGRIGVGFVVAVVMMAGIGFSSYLALNRMVDAANWRQHTYQVVEELQRTMTHLVDAETGERGFIITGEERYLEPYNRAIVEVHTCLADLQVLTADNPHQQQRIEALKPKVDQKLSVLAEGIAVRRDQDFDGARRVVEAKQGKGIMEEIRALVAEMMAEENRLLEQRTLKMDDRTRYAKHTIVWGTLFAAVLLTVAGAIVGRNIARPLVAISRVASQVAAGDLSADIPLNTRSDEVGVLTDAFRQMIESIRSTTAGITEGVALLGSSSSEILAATTQVAAGAVETATAISETTTTVEEVRQAARLSAEKASGVSGSAQRVVQVAQKGTAAVEEVESRMHHIREQMASIAQTIVRLSEQSQTIGGIIASVTDLADQSKLLAVNAAIEAARAGEHGKGFAVVAQEIKSLADESKRSAAQVRAILDEVQKATGAAVMATEQGSKSVEAGVRQSALAGESIDALAEASGDAAQAATQIAASSQQQVVGMDQLGSAMESINEAGAQTAVSMKQAETTSRDLFELGEKLKRLVARYKV